MSYSPSFTRTYPNGWKDRPDTSTPAYASTFEKYENTFEAIEDFLDGSEAVKPVNKTSAMTQDVGFDPSTGKLYTKPGSGGGGGGTASSVTYDNTESQLESTNVQDAIDELAKNSGGGISEDYLSHLYKLGSKNLFPHRKIDESESYGDNLTVTIDDDGVITLNGTSDSGDSTEVTLYGNISVPFNATYIIDGVYPENTYLSFQSNPSSIYETITDEDFEAQLDTEHTYSATLRISDSSTFNNVKIRPMLRLKKTTFVGEDVEKEFVPFAKTNNQLTKDVADLRELLDNFKIICSEETVLESSNWGADPFQEFGLPIYNDMSFIMNHQYILSIEIPYFSGEQSTDYLARLQAYKDAGIMIHGGVLLVTGTTPSIDIPVKIIRAYDSYVENIGSWNV